MDTRFRVTEEAEMESEEMGSIVGAYTTKHWKQYRNLPEETRNLIYYFLWDNYRLPGLMEMSLEEVLALAKESRIV